MRLTILTQGDGWQSGEKRRERKRNLLSLGRRIRYVSIASKIAKTYFSWLSVFGYQLSVKKLEDSWMEEWKGGRVDTHPSIPSLPSNQAFPFPLKTDNQ
jgi:hypothetical protein